MLSADNAEESQFILTFNFQKFVANSDECQNLKATSSTQTRLASCTVAHTSMSQKSNMIMTIAKCTNKPQANNKQEL